MQKEKRDCRNLYPSNRRQKRKKKVSKKEDGKQKMQDAVEITSNMSVITINGNILNIS